MIDLDVDRVPIEELPAIILELLTLQGRAAARLHRAVTPAPETLLTADEVAAILRTTEDWVRHEINLPFRVKVGGHVRYSPSGLARYQREQEERRR